MAKRKKKLVKKQIEQKEIINTEKKEEKEITPTVKPEDNQYFEIMDKEHKHPFVKLLIFLIVIAICVFGFYKYVIWNNKGIFSSGINYTYKNIGNLIGYLNDKNIFSKPTGIDGVLSVNTNDQNYRELNKYQFNLSAKIDLENKKFNDNTDVLKDDNQLLNLSYDYQNNNNYLDLNGIYDKTIKLVNSNQWIDWIFKNFKKVDYVKLNSSMNTIKGIINDNIDSNKLKLGKDTIVIDDNSYDLNYVSLNLSKEEYSKLLVNIINNIEDNHKLMDNLGNALNVSEETIHDNLSELLKDSLIGDFKTLELKVYVNGYMANVVGLSVVIDDDEVLKTIDVNNNKINHIKYDNYDMLIVNNNVTINKDDNKILTAKINENSATVLDVDYVYIENKNYGNIHIERNSISDNLIHGKISFSLVNKDNINYSFNYDYSLNTDIKIDDIDESNVIDINKLSEDDYLNIYQQLKDKTKETIFASYINNLVESLLKY